jgi:cytochrome oxidase Cu insertion factor (SCO1/SenC/PrrC family)
MYIKVGIYSAIVFGSLWWINSYMTKLVKKRRAALNGEPEALTEKDLINKVGGHWVLKDLNGKDFGSPNLNGTYYLLYFGFSLCPDVCSITLMKMTKAIRKIKNSKEGQ